MNESPTICVLLIEDSPLDLFLFRALLAKITDAHVELLHAERLRDAIVLLHAHKVDVVFTDLNLPDSNGADTVRGLLAGGADVPLTVLTGYADSGVEAGLLAEGAAGLLSKDGLTAPALSQAIHEAMQHKRAER
jgi:glutamate dehydrogenase (NAD(P)+)